MKATNTLMEEHRLIEHLLDALETQAARLQTGTAVRTGFFLDAVDFNRTFADGCHHRKEEGALFPAMVAVGLSEESGPIAVMLAEHDQGREFNRGMEKAARAVEAGQADARSDLAQSALGYVSLLRQHIRKEDAVLFPMADRLIPGDAQDKLALEFDRIEREETGLDTHERYHALAKAMVKEAGVEG
jgi:hemerythrin-like domain-containing protein